MSHERMDRLASEVKRTAWAVSEALGATPQGVARRHAVGPGLAR
jgi:hypothetical protein